jgi:hypothetical protein
MLANNCVELVVTAQVTAIRDSKHAVGAALAVTAESWSILVSHLTRGRIR